MTIFYLRLHMSEMFAGFVLTLGALLVWTFMHRKDNVFTNRYVKKMVAGLLMGAVVMIGMFSGLAFEEGHSWGNPHYAMGLALQHPWRVFHNDDNLLLIGILYVIFQLIGACVAFVAYVVYVWAYNFATRDQEKHIIITQMFKFDETHTIGVLVKDAFASFIVILAVIGASNFAKMPEGWPANDTVAFATAFITGIATMFAISIFGVRGVLTLNPFAWAMAFVLKLLPAMYLNRKSITWKAMLREFASPVAVLGVAAVSGLMMAGIISLPYEKA